MYIHYIGTSDIRSISRDEWASIDEGRGGPIDHDDVHWLALNGWVAQVSKEAGAFLSAYDPEMVNVTKSEAQDIEKAAELAADVEEEVPENPPTVETPKEEGE